MLLEVTFKKDWNLYSFVTFVTFIILYNNNNIT